jgi:hypothetical protein
MGRNKAPNSAVATPYVNHYLSIEVIGRQLKPSKQMPMRHHLFAHETVDLCPLKTERTYVTRIWKVTVN